jgi:hypothetical protein
VPNETPGEMAHLPLTPTSLPALKPFFHLNGGCTQAEVDPVKPALAGLPPWKGLPDLDSNPFQQILAKLGPVLDRRFLRLVRVGTGADQ